jgi:hypothetical protein
MTVPQHATSVDAWLKRSTKGLSSERLLSHFEAAFRVLWQRAITPLGEVTLTAIAERVLYTAAEKFPRFSTIKLDATDGIQCRELHQQVDSVRRAELIEGFHFVLVEFVSVLGNLTAEILTAGLCSELCKVAAPKVSRVKRATKRKPGARRKKETP